MNRQLTYHTILVCTKYGWINVELMHRFCSFCCFPIGTVLFNFISSQQKKNSDSQPYSSEALEICKSQLEKLRVFALHILSINSVMNLTIEYVSFTLMSRKQVGDNFPLFFHVSAHLLTRGLDNFFLRMFLQDFFIANSLGR